MAGNRLRATHCGGREIRNWSIELNFGEEAAAFRTLTRFPAKTNDRGPIQVGLNCGQSWNAAMKAGLTLTEVDERIAAIRENLDQLVEQSTADSSAGNDDLNATRIAEQEQELAELTELRETLLRK
jgi:hypothetical protein